MSQPTPHSTPLRLRIASRSHPGCMRTRNEDAFLVASFGAGAVMAVCDGMGGNAGGAEASRLVVDVLEQTMLSGRPPRDRDELGQRLLAALAEAQRRVLSVAARRRELAGMGTTATVCGLVDDRLVIAQVGDSRAYLCRGGRLTQLTRDQTLVTLLVEQGQLAPEEARSCQLSHVILQAVGTAEGVEVDLRTVPVGEGDVLLICSDGLCGPVTDQSIAAVLAAEHDCTRAADALVALAIEAGGPDNVTCIVARIFGGRPIADEPAVDKLYLRADIDDSSGSLRESLADLALRPTAPDRRA
jgi:protein phosphatase